ncbi:Alpha-2-macroglobulin [Balamuthia mandrillaris]
MWWRWQCSVLSLVDYILINPLSSFYPQQYTSINWTTNFTNVTLEKEITVPEESPPVDEFFTEQRYPVLCSAALMAEECEESPKRERSMKKESRSLAMKQRQALDDTYAEGCLGGGGQAAPSATPIQLRTNFNATALFAPTVITDSEGHAKVEFTLPDNLTRYRIMAVASSQAAFYGTAESNLSVSQPIMLRPSLPRFMNVGDRATFSVVVQSQSEQSQSILAALRAQNALLAGVQGYHLVLKPHHRAKLEFTIEAKAPGKLTVQLGACSLPENGKKKDRNEYVDATEITIPVLTPAQTEAFVTYGELDGTTTIAQSLQVPPDARLEYGGLNVQLSSTALQALTDAVLYIKRYPFECTEQIASRSPSCSTYIQVLGWYSGDQEFSPPHIHRQQALYLRRHAG